MDTMRAVLLAGVISLTQTGCAGMWAGAGAAGAATAYEAHSKYELDQLNRDYESGKMSQAEYEARKKQIEKGSVIY
jgi:hypothetical protein